MSSLKEIIVKVYAKYVVKETLKWSNNPIQTQEKVMKMLVSKAKNTKFGKDHNFEKILNYKGFSKQIPVRDYEDIKPYIEKIIEGNKSIYGLENQFISAKHLGQLLEQNIFQLQKRACHAT